jgi:hypothetical protein
VLAFRLLFALNVCLLLVSCTTFRATAGDASPESLLDRIWPQSPPPKRILGEQDQQYAEAALVQWLESYLEPAYKVVDKRFFWGDRESSGWVPVGKAHALYNENANGRWRNAQEIEQSWTTPGSGYVRLWKVDIDGRVHYFAVAMTKYPVPGTRGRRLIGRFEIERIE